MCNGLFGNGSFIEKQKGYDNMIILVIGGSASGKSEYAESRMMAWENRVYLATMLPYGRESERTILRHRLLRKGKGFQTIECGAGLAQIEIDPEQAILLEDLPNLVANELYAKENGLTDDWSDDLDDPDLWIDDSVLEMQTVELAEELPPEERIETDLKHLMQAKHLVVVTGDIFADGIDYDAETDAYRKLLARTNQWVARYADEVYEVIHGIPVRRK